MTLIAMHDLDIVVGGIGLRALDGIFGSSGLVAHHPPPSGSALLSRPPPDLAPADTTGLPPGYVAVPAELLQNLLVPARAALPPPTPVPAPQANPLAQIQQGLGLAQQALALFRDISGLAKAAGGLPALPDLGSLVGNLGEFGDLVGSSGLGDPGEIPF